MKELKKGSIGIIEAVPLSLQHVIAMVVGCVTVPTLVSNAAGLGAGDRIIMMQAALFCAGLGILLQTFNLWGKVGSGLPVIIGAGFVYIPTMTALAGNPEMGISALLGGQLVGAIVGIIFGLVFKRIRFLFAPVVTASVVLTIGILLYKTVVGYMAGGIGKPTFGSGLNWMVAIFTLTATLIFSQWGKGVFKVAATLLGLICGYILSIALNMVDFSSVGSAPAIQMIPPLHFGMNFVLGAIIPMSFMFIINSIEGMGQFEATAHGAFQRDATDEEITGGVNGNNITSLIGAFLGGSPNATAGQNVGIVLTTGITDKIVFYLAGAIVIVSALSPKIASVFVTIPAPVLGGATVMVFGSIAMTGIRMLAKAELTNRNMTIVGLGVALGIGLSYHPTALQGTPGWAQMLFGGSDVVVVALITIVLNLILPQEKKTTVQEIISEDKAEGVVQILTEDILTQEEMEEALEEDAVAVEKKEPEA